MQVTVKQGQNIFDVAMQTAGSISAAFALAMLNGAGITDDLAIGDVLTVPAPVDKSMLQHYSDNGVVPATAVSGHPVPFAGIAGSLPDSDAEYSRRVTDRVTVKQGQNIFDIAIQTAGSVSAAFSMAMLNGSSITDDLAIGDVLTVSTPADKGMLRYYRNAGIIPATATATVTDNILKMEGISYWFINDDFVVNG